MSTLSESLATKLPPNYVPVPQKPPVISMVPANSSPAVNLRCILPPFNSDPDTLRQFDNQSTGPKLRIWPSPQQSSSSTTNVQSSGFGAASPSSGGSVASSIVAKAGVITTGVLVPGSPFQTTLQMSESFQLLSVSANGPCEVRIYGTQIAQAFDLGRPIGNPVPPEITSNIITCVTLSTSPFLWGWQNRIGANQNIPQTTTAYVTVLNLNPALTAPVTISIQYIPLESA